MNRSLVPDVLFWVYDMVLMVYAYLAFLGLCISRRSRDDDNLHVRVKFLLSVLCHTMSSVELNVQLHISIVFAYGH